MRPQFSLVVPTYNVEPYLGDFLDSLAAQTYPTDAIDIVFVDDGSTDSSAEMIARWSSSYAPRARLLRKENGGLSSARNLGLGHVSGTWVTFCDPDDTISPNYFASVSRLLDNRGPDAPHLIACRLLMHEERTGAVRDSHPLRFRFGRRDRVVDLSRHPRHIHLSAATGFYRTDLIERRRLRFDGRIRPTFEDAHFTGLYLAEHDRPRVAFLARPAYYYRRRQDASSLVQSSWVDPAKFTNVLRYGYLDLLEQVSGMRGNAPVWLQNLVLYDLVAYFTQDDHMDSTLGRVSESVAGEFHNLIVEIMNHIDVMTIRSYSIPGMSRDARTALMIDTKGELRRPDDARIDAIDREQQLARVRYYYGGTPPSEAFQVDGASTVPRYGKHRAVSYLGRRMASERIAWLPAGKKIEVFVDGRFVPIGENSPSTVEDKWHATALRQLRRRASIERKRARHGVLVGRAVVSHLHGKLDSPSRSGVAARRYRDAWVFTDRNGLAQDNAEHLYRFVRERHPEINAWFVVDRDSTDWPRLDRDGFSLVHYGTADHVLLLINCVELISSHIDQFAVDPLLIGRFGRRRRRFTFLQHGVTKDDFSRQLNHLPISRLITATHDESRLIAGDGSPYVVTDKEVELTGFPRHDRLLRLAGATNADAVDRLLLVMPTWRRHLTGHGPHFLASPYSRKWLDLLRSERLGELAERAGLKIAFVPHPNTVGFGSASLPAHVQTHRYQDVDIQALFARGTAMITDYSSNAFELAYLNRPVIYFQFDRDDFYSGQHVFRRGQWSYEHDGFGAVVENVTNVVEELAMLVDRDMKPAEPYASRMAQAFAFHDGRCCERTFESICAARQRPPV